MNERKVKYQKKLDKLVTDKAFKDIISSSDLNERGQQYSAHHFGSSFG